MDVVKTLSYSAGPPRSQRIRRRTMTAVALAGGITLLLIWGPVTWRWIQFVYWQHRCLTCALAPDRVVIDGDSIARGKSRSDIAERIQFERMTGMAADQSETIFLHKMRRPDGTVRLVSISRDFVNVWAPGSFGTPAQCLWTAQGPQPNDVGAPWGAASLNLTSASEGFKVYAGQCDSHDPSHLTVKVVTNGAISFIDGWLGNDDKLLIAARH
jgi:hypothetical protein